MPKPKRRHYSISFDLAQLVGLTAIATALIGAGNFSAVILHDHSNAHTEALNEDLVKRAIERDPGFVLDAINKHVETQALNQQKKAIDALKADTTGGELGNPLGDVTIYEFVDYNCGFCRRVHPDIKQLIEGDDMVRVSIREFPILSAGSREAARYALAAARQGKYREFHDALLSVPGKVDRVAADFVAEQVGLERAQLEQDLKDPEIDAALERNAAVARALQLTGTPGFVIGDEVIAGAMPLDRMKELVAAARRRAN